MLGYYFLTILCSVYFLGCNGAILGQACNNAIDCTGTYQYCDTTCKCNTGYTQSDSACLAGFGYSCASNSDCFDISAVCSGDPPVCTCDTVTHYESSGSCATKIALGGACPQGDTCAGDNTECYGGTCKCTSEYYEKNSACVIRIAYGGNCLPGDVCAGDNTECSGGTCQCSSGSSRNNGACVNNIAYEGDCSGGGFCAGDNTECRGGTCQCSSGYNWDNSACVANNLAHGDDCSGGDTCAGDNIECSGTCQCKSGYYWNNMVCVNKVELGGSCTSDAACKGSNTKCDTSSTQKCVCDNGYYDTTGTSDIGGTCLLKVDLGGSCSSDAACKGSYTKCDTSSTQKCVCIDTYYDDTGTSNVGGTCLLKVALGETCSSNAACKGENTKCSTSGKCVCIDTYYDDTGTSDTGGTCVLKISTGSSCPSNLSPSVPCSDTNARCTSTNNAYKCTCIDGYYNENGICTISTIKELLGAGCTLATDCADGNAECSSQICTCKSGYYDNTGASNTGGTCVAKKNLGSSCPNPSVTNILSTDSCIDSNALCQLSGSTYTCRCRSSYYDDNGVNVLGGNCRFKILLGAQCPVPTSDVPNTATCLNSKATCISDGSNYKCLCPSDYYDSNGVNTGGGECLPKKTFGSICPNPSVTNILSTDSCKDSNALCQLSGSTYICSCRSSYYDDNVVNDPGGNYANQLSRDSEATSSDMTAIIVGVVLGIINLVLLLSNGYLMVKLRRLSNQGQTKQPDVQQQPQYVNQMLLDVVSQSPDVENIPSPEDNYTSLNEETREDKSTYETF